MITIIPSDAIVLAMKGHTVRTYQPVDWWMAYEWFARRLLEWKPNGTPCEVLRATSGINHRSFSLFWDEAQPVDHLAYLFKQVGFGRAAATRQFVPNVRAQFLSRLGIRKWADLAKPIDIHGRRPKVFPRREWFDMEGRTFKEPGLNPCHPKARTLYGVGLRFSAYAKRWKAQAVYGYPHDSSSWIEEVIQRPRESLDRFAERIDAQLEAWLEPDPGPGLRRERESRWKRVHDAVDNLFWSDCPRAERAIADILVGVEGASLVSGRIALTPSRLATLKRWARDTVGQNHCERKDKP